MHWTQKPENRARLSLIRKRSAALRKKRGKHTTATRAKIGAAVRARHAAQRLNGTMSLHLNGHALTPAIPLTGKRLAKAAVAALAVDGARNRLALLDREREVLLIFIQAAAQTRH